MPTDNSHFQNEIDLLKKQLLRLEAHLNLPAITQATVPTVLARNHPLARRRALKRMGALLLSGAVAGAATLSFPQAAEAKLTANPSTNGMSDRVGVFITPPGAAAPTGNLPGTSKYGMIITGDTTALNLDLSSTLTYGDDSYGLLALTETGTAVFGNSTSGYGVAGGSTNSYGVNGSSTSSYGVNGGSTNSYGVNGSSSNSNGVNGSSTSSNGVRGASSNGNGVLGESNIGYGVYGRGISPDGNNTGVGGNSINGIGVQGVSTNGSGVRGNSESSLGVMGISTTSAGVYGFSTGSVGVQGASDNGVGVYGLSDTDNGVVAFSTSEYALYANGNNSNAGLAGYFLGKVEITGAVTKPAGSFKIDHPTDPANKYLYHSFVESPDMLNIYNGNATLDANGQATISMPQWFDALNRDFRYQLTAIGGSAPGLHISQELGEGSFKIAGGIAGLKVSWQVTGIRQDAYANAHRIPVEEDKNQQERGKYLYPDEHKQPAEKGINFSRKKLLPVSPNKK